MSNHAASAQLLKLWLEVAEPSQDDNPGLFVGGMEYPTNLCGVDF